LPVRTCGVDPFGSLLKYALQACCGTVDTMRSVLVTLPHQSQHPRSHSWSGTIVAYLNMPPFALNTAGSRLRMRFSGHNGVGRSVLQSGASKLRRLRSDDQRRKHRFYQSRSWRQELQQETRGTSEPAALSWFVLLQSLPNQHASEHGALLQALCRNRLSRRFICMAVNLSEKSAADFGNERSPNL
jgi:hypothetical protein